MSVEKSKDTKGYIYTYNNMNSMACKNNNVQNK